MFKTAISLKAAAAAVSILGFYLVCFIGGWPLFGHNTPDVPARGVLTENAFAGTSFEAPEPGYTGIVWGLNCGPEGTRYSEIDFIAPLLCATPLAALVGEGGQLGLVPLLLLAVVLPVVGYFLLWRLPLLLLRGGMRRLWQLLRRLWRDERGSVPAKSIRNNFASDEFLLDHYQRHGKKLGYKTMEEYLEGANQFFRRNEGVVFRPNGDKHFFDSVTGEFGIIDKNGIIRTYFKPRAGVDYFLKDIFKAMLDRG